MVLPRIRRGLSRVGYRAVRKRPQTFPFGVNVSGYVTSEKGVGEAARSFIRALRAAGIQYSVEPVLDPEASNVEEAYSSDGIGSPYIVNLVCVNADMVPKLVSDRGHRYLFDRHSIGVWNWELEVFPAKFARSADAFDEIWVPSSFVARAVQPMVDKPVSVVPYCVRPTETAGGDLRARLAIQADAFVFLFAFDERSILERKNPFGLISAFKKAFTEHDDAILIVKGSRLSYETTELLRAQASKRLLLIPDVLSPADMSALYATADCYVSLHRSEGFGLTMLEAMSRGLPVIATAYGGNLDFMTDDAAYLVDYRRRRLGRDMPPYAGDATWAEPDVDHAAALMRAAYEDRPSAAAVGARARALVEEQLSPARVGGLIAARLGLGSGREQRGAGFWAVDA